MKRAADGMDLKKNVDWDRDTSAPSGKGEKLLMGRTWIW